MEFQVCYARKIKINDFYYVLLNFIFFLRQNFNFNSFKSSILMYLFFKSIQRSQLFSEFPPFLYGHSLQLPAALPLAYVKQSCAGILKQFMGARNQVLIGLSCRPARLHRLAELIPWNRFLGSLKVLKFGLCCCRTVRRHQLCCCAPTGDESPALLPTPGQIFLPYQPQNFSPNCNGKNLRLIKGASMNCACVVCQQCY